MKQVGIIGGAGYTAGELIRLLLHHPEVEISWIQSDSQAENPIYRIHQDLLGATSLHFQKEIHWEIDLVFLCKGHGFSAPFLAKHPIPPSVKIIDFSRDFRLRSDEHSFVYGLPELNKAIIQSSRLIANCGCFATAIQLALLPLAAKQQLATDVHVHALTGSTGAGQKPSSTTHFSWRNNNISVYKAFQHQHLDEIQQSLKSLQNEALPPIHFVPIRGDFTRGIFASLYTDIRASLDEIQQWYQDFYADAPFVVLSSENIHLKQVVNTNKCLIYLQKHGDKLHIISILDNLIKGAAGQAVQNMNLCLGLDETNGLKLKAAYF